MVSNKLKSYSSCKKPVKACALFAYDFADALNIQRRIGGLQISAERMIEFMREAFCECNDIKMPIDTWLGELPERYSMAAVNLQIFLL